MSSVRISEMKKNEIGSIHKISNGDKVVPHWSGCGWDDELRMKQQEDLSLAPLFACVVEVDKLEEDVGITYHMMSWVFLSLVSTSFCKDGEMWDVEQVGVLVIYRVDLVKLTH